VKHAVQSFLTSYLLGCNNYKIIKNVLVLHNRFRIPLESFSETGFHTYLDTILDEKGNSLSFLELVEQLSLMEDVSEENLKAFNHRVKKSAENTSALLESKKELIKSVEALNDLSFKTTEQVLYAGHFSHPYPKLQEGNVHESLNLKWCLIHKDILHIETSSYFSKDTLNKELNTLAGVDNRDSEFLLYPFHPFQFSYFAEADWMQSYLSKGLIKVLAFAEKEWTPTTSIRSLYNEDAKWMLKYSLNVRLTNSIRTLQINEVKRGMQLHEVFQSSKGMEIFLDEDMSTLSILHEPAFMALKNLEGETLKETIVVLRENPFRNNNEKIISLATLNQIIPHSTLINNKAKAKEWFSSFLDKVILPFVLLQGRHGIYLGAHQQNIIIKLDKNNYPEHMFYRDCQGTGYSQMGFEKFKTEAQSLNNPNGNVLDSSLANTLIGYYLFINSTLFTIKSIAQGDRELEIVLINDFTSKLSLLNIKDRSFIKYALESESFYIKDNYECCVKNINENTMSNPLDIYKKFKNPFFKVNMKSFNIKRINTNDSYAIEINSSILMITKQNDERTYYFHPVNETIHVETSSKNMSADFNQVAFEALFNYQNEVKEIAFNNDEIISRENFYKQTLLWNIPTRDLAHSEEIVETNSVQHPKRYPFTAGQKLYSRYVHTIQSTVSFRVIKESDLDVFYDWHNQPRVANFWELAGSKEAILAYIQKGLTDPHLMPVIAEINGEAVGYFEIYWTKEDRLGPYYESGFYDRGFHLLVGNEKYLGFNNTDALLKSACHFIYLDDERTQYIMGEPRHDNQKLLKYVLSFKSWRRVKEFDFPHKRAVLLECDKNLFFQGQYL
jgi:N2-citryl-N6-acetyl-N6-hydroxylysine synthase